MAQLDRRTFIAGALGAAGALAAARAGLAQAASPRRIDVHHHFVPPFYLQELGLSMKLNPTLSTWSLQKDMELLEAGGVERAIMSITTPGLWFGLHTAARDLARRCNDYAAKIVSDHSNRYGMYVNVSLPDVDGTLKEIEYGMDTLKAAGVAVFTSYGDKWLGDPAFEPVYAELNRRKAVMYTHPPDPSCCMNLLKTDAFNEAAIEYGTDTTRAIAKWFVSGAAKKYPDIRIIWSHGGGTLTSLYSRFQGIAGNPRNKEFFPDGLEAGVRKFYYDTASHFHRVNLIALKELVPVSQIVFGTDVPYGNPKRIADGVADTKLFSPEELAMIDRGNAERLFPQYRG
jgi:predicted TIM-barrel fold metal-dependent hydrolase